MPKSINDPNMGHMKTSDFKLVYEFNDDTYLLVDALEKDYIVNHLLNSKCGLKCCLEIGSGSGYVTTFLYKLLNNNHQLMNASYSFLLLCSDINPNAALMTRKTLENNKITPQQVPICCDVVLTDFHSAFKQRMKNKIDLLIFNPPYVPSEQYEMGHNDVRAAYAGGIDGREVIDKFIPMIKDILSRDGVFYFVLIEDNRPQEVMKLLSLEENGGFASKIVLKKWVQGEYLFIVKFFKSC
ncbi:predicted protein [Naegleria gruberi]|uniref:Predicted protein n=1 Tax=Naegleria gruberi TaxID=5762 RepID=D2V941_NAEGR|nr:uncharacterized protein NAEGRDRAFT_32258 [Naegleria gruberi]EFC46644.1 predicted protein [Naegleria gruberi]|eukprot:XP_002679388.1 predicted protein [Naegleria gruberi strain NEG-M]